jgi:hypothetical protein
VVENATTVPKEAITRQANATGVLKLQGEIVVWQPVKVGASSVTRVQVIEGLAPGDAVALPIDRPIASGNRVQPVFAE